MKHQRNMQMNFKNYGKQNNGILQNTSEST